ncbi:D-2-hydroxyacid dehydrogenase [Thiofilum flexile]|uniref:D-2-hydroxyacid dehydrogenase n=1 Tax=Thiofilum flexile TaxID=125627 RepID=UPI000378376A|nr:D-2-hydroxyacid dehydrogenase [Thiofilum flexile]
MPTVVFLDTASTQAGDLDLTPLSTACQGQLTLWPHTPAAQIQEHIGTASIVISNKVPIDAALMHSQRDTLKLICVAATGTNNIDLNAARQLNIPVTNVRDYGSQSVAEHVFSLIFALSRSLPAYQQELNQGAWQRAEQFCLLNHPIRELAGNTLLIIGGGTLGQATARLGQALGMKILFAERPHAPTRAGKIALEAGLQQADVVSLHCPLTPETTHLINAERLALMQSHALLINTARGGIVDETALLAALRQGQIGGAGIDVLPQEPPIQGNPLLEAQLPNLIVTPHIAWASRTARQRLIEQLAQIISTFINTGEVLNQVA